MADNFGGAFTGLNDGTDSPLKNIVTGAASGLNRAIFDDPASRSALLQIGLNLMQPQAQGQTVAGHIGEAIGAGGEAVGRQEEGDIKQQLADTKLQRAQDLMDIARQKLAQGPEGLTAYQKIQAELQQRRDARQQSGEERAQSREERAADAKEEERISSAAEKMYKATHGFAADPEDPNTKEFGAMSEDQIFDALKARRTKRTAPTAAPPTTLAPAAAGGVMPPREQRIPGQTKYGDHVWTKDPKTGEFGWLRTGQ